VVEDWKKRASANARHARLMKRRPELREALYGCGREAKPAADRPHDLPPATRETAQEDGT
jgi:hypothetical protein